MLRLQGSREYIKILKQFVENYNPKHPVNLFVFGPPGIGKTQILHAIFKDWFVFNLRLSTTNIEDIVGIPLPNGNWIIPSFLKKLQEHEKSILFLDEINMGREVLSAVFNLIDRQELINGFRLREDIIVIAAGNRIEDNVYAKHLAFPLRNRFVYIEYEPTAEDFASYLGNTEKFYDDIVYDRYTDLDKKLKEAKVDIKDVIAKFVIDNQDLIHYKYNDKIKDVVEDLYAFPTPRSIEYGINLVKYYKFSVEDAFMMSCGDYFTMKLVDYLNALLQFHDIENDIKNKSVRIFNEIDKNISYINLLSLKITNMIRNNNDLETAREIMIDVYKKFPEELIQLMHRTLKIIIGEQEALKFITSAINKGINDKKISEKILNIFKQISLVRSYLD